MGIEFRESALLIGPKTTVTAKKGQVYNINLGFSELVNSSASDSESKKYALFIGDTVVVNEVSKYKSNTHFNASAFILFGQATSCA